MAAMTTDTHGISARWQSEGEWPDAAFAVEPERRGALGAATSIIGALSSVALVVGLGLWTYDLAVRDLSGVPVVRALEGPARVAPEAPGGEIAPHQGLAVNAVQAASPTVPVPDHLTLAPAPTDLAPDDAPALSAEELAAAAEARLAAEAEEAALAEAEEVRPPSPNDLMIAAAIAGEELPAEEALRAAVQGTGGELMPTSLAARRPPARPAAPVMTADEVDPIAQAVLMAVAASTGGSAAETAPESIAAGTWMVQLGAFPEEGDARAAWDRLGAAAGAYLAGKSRVVQQAENGGRQIWRLRATGFSDADDARRFCAAIEAGGDPCVPVVAR